MIRGLARSLAALALCASIAGAFAQSADHGAMGHDHGAPAGEAPSTSAFKQADAAMHRDMNRSYTGDADRDFVAGMIPHHRGAIDMAKVVLAHGKDPEVRKLAEEIIAAQEREIADMQRMLARLERDAADKAKKP